MTNDKKIQWGSTLKHDINTTKYNKIKNAGHPNYEDSLQSKRTLEVIPGDKY